MLVILSSLLLNSCSKEKEKGLKIYIDYTYSNTLVGSDWNNACYVNGVKINSGDIVSSDKDKITIDIYVEEKDKYPDKGYKSIDIDVYNGSEIKTNIIVYEDNGRYKGKSVNVSVKIILKEFYY